jgi:hypothetical protein
MTDIPNAIAGAISLTKKLLSLAAVANDATAKLAIADLQVQLAELKTHLAELIDENSQLKQELKAFKSAGVEVVVKDGLYYKPDGDGPFCTACYDSGKTLSRITELGAAFRPIARWRCNVCKATYGGK